MFGDMDSVNRYTVAWVAWAAGAVAGFGAIERWAMAREERCDDEVLDTLSRHMQWMTRHPAARAGFVAAVVGFEAWLMYHLWGQERPSSPTQ